MTKVPPGIAIDHDEPDYTTMITGNYSDSLYLMQLILMILPLSVLSIWFIIDIHQGLFYTLPLLALVVYWTIYNKRDHYFILLTDQRLLITRGMNKRVIIDIPLKTIKEVKFNYVYDIIAGKYEADSLLNNKNELIIHTKNDAVFITNSLLDSEQLFLQKTIMEWVERYKDK